jgi:anti-sigma regulatory factor (Ser/Thr protein kinase)
VFEPPPDLSLPLGREPTAPRQARAGIRRLLGDRVSPDFAEDAQLLTSELVTNAVMYTPSGCSLSAWYVDDQRALRVEVADEASDIPRVRPPSAPSHVGGRGLQLVASRSTNWGVVPNGGGKSVWFELRS